MYEVGYDPGLPEQGPHGYCIDYPCCGHTDGDPCPGRGTPVTESWYCDECGMNHYTLTCPAEDYDMYGEDD